MGRTEYRCQEVPCESSAIMSVSAFIEKHGKPSACVLTATFPTAVDRDLQHQHVHFCFYSQPYFIFHFINDLSLSYRDSLLSLLSDGIHCSYVFPAEYDVPLNADWKTVTWKEGKLLHLPRRPTAWVEGDAPGWERQELGDCSDEQEDARPAPEGTKKPP